MKLADDNAERKAQTGNHRQEITDRKSQTGKEPTRQDVPESYTICSVRHF